MEQPLKQTLNSFISVMTQRLEEKEEEGYTGWDKVENYAYIMNALLKDIVLVDKAARFFRITKQTHELDLGKEKMKLLLVDISNRALMLHNLVDVKWKQLEGNNAE